MGLLSRLVGLGGDPEKGSDLTFVTAQINHPLQPIERGEVYEIPLNDVLVDAGAGVVEGGGTMTEQGGEISFIDLEIGLSEGDEGGGGRGGE